ncbi:two-component system sensor histidine kinase VanS [Agromyces hippuratus]|uniref:histidine kinase n=1 Tax=Agromyces hippuratus TaxID=286438 RepID=A0A852X288_9MICO|nr:HAMP domain-containing sensor histidine kinase [Agromyces hippuratus]NYG22263.1 two-component system sensor histidine kinase VanS [Agromyces hippuratus]
MTEPAASVPRTYRLTVRARLALTYAVLLTIAGAVLLAIVAFVIGLVPSYEFAEPAATTTTAIEATPTDAIPAQSTLPSDSPEVAYDPGLLASTASEAAVVVSSRSDILQLLLWVSVGALALLAAGGAWAGWFVAGRMLRPLQEVNEAAHRAARGHLDHRIALAGPRDEITDLADTFDGMLDSLERSANADRRFAANASHELRTPLATTRTMLDVALSSQAAGDVQLLERLREMNERSIETVEALLDLSELESTESGTFAPVDLAAVAASVVDESRVEAEEAGVRLDSSLEPASVEGDEVLLRQLVVNLVQNAIRHNEPGGFVTVTTDAAGSLPSLEVENSGAELDAATVATLTAPFARGGGRTRDASDRGRGLGLSIVAAIVARHDGGLDLAPRAGGGLRAVVRFPR